MWIFNQEHADFWQFVKFTIVGMLNSALYIVVFALFMLINQETTTALIGSSVAWFVSTTNSYYMNRKLAFAGVKVLWWSALIKFYLGYVFTSLLLYSALTYVQMEIIGTPTGLVPVVNVLVVGPVNFVIAKFWSMKPIVHAEGERMNIQQEQGSPISWT